VKQSWRLFQLSKLTAQKFGMRKGPFIIIEDDQDDQEIIKDVFQELGITNEILFFDRCVNAFNFLKSEKEQPFIILCDINLPTQTGIEFKRKIDSDPELRRKSIPFVFFSTSVDKKTIDTAYKELTVQGYFKKDTQYDALKKTIKLIVDYWTVCKHPNS